MAAHLNLLWGDAVMQVMQLLRPDQYIAYTSVKLQKKTARILHNCITAQLHNRTTFQRICKEEKKLYF